MIVISKKGYPGFPTDEEETGHFDVDDMIHHDRHAERQTKAKQVWLGPSLSVSKYILTVHTLLRIAPF